MSNEYFNWDDEVQKDGFSLLEPGTYKFVLVKEEKSTSQSGKPMLKLTWDYDGTHVYDNIVMLRTMEWKISSFFVAIGLKEKGKPFVFKWNNEGAQALIKVGVEEYQDKNGNTKTKNVIEEYLAQKKAELKPAPKGVKSAFKKSEVPPETVASNSPQDNTDDLPF